MKFSDSARQRMLRGVAILAEAVRTSQPIGRLRVKDWKTIEQLFGELTINNKHQSAFVRILKKKHFRNTIRAILNRSLWIFAKAITLLAAFTPMLYKCKPAVDGKSDRSIKVYSMCFDNFGLTYENVSICLMRKLNCKVLSLN